MRKTALQKEGAGIAACVLIYFVLRLWNQSGDLLNDKFDEGVYLSLMQGVAAGKGQLYRDYLLCHPPGVMWIGAWLWPRVHGNIITLRMLYVAVCSIGLIPVYAISRRICGVWAALITLFLLASSPGLANWLGRCIFLDPILNVALFAALWLMFKEDRKQKTENRRAGIALSAGVLVGVSFLIKETALPAALAIGFALWNSRNSNLFARRAWLWFGVGSILAFAVVLVCLSHIPNYIHYTFTLNADEPRNWTLRLREFESGFYALPLPLTFGFVGVMQMLRNRQNPGERFLAVYALATTLLMFAIPKNFYWRYFMGAFPVYCLGVAVWWRNYQAAPRSVVSRRVVGTLAALLILVHCVSLILYRTHESKTPPEMTDALNVLRESPDPLLTSSPLWAAASGHAMTPNVQKLIIATNHLPVPLDWSAAAMRECPTVLLEKEALRWLPPPVLAAIRRDYHTVYRYGVPGDNWYVEILRR